MPRLRVDDQISYTAFIQRVRRHRPSELLPHIAFSALQFSNPQELLRRQQLTTPWALAAAAKESITRGNENRPRGVSHRDIDEICAHYNNVRDPLTDRSRADMTSSPGAFMTRMAYEQFPGQISQFEEIARLQALYGGSGLAQSGGSEISVLASVLGCTLSEFVAAGMVFGTGAAKNDGYFDPNWINQENFEEIREVVSGPVLRRVFEEHFRIEPTAFRRIVVQQGGADDLARYDYNPLVGKPFVHMPDGRYLAPQPRFIFDKVTSASMYYTIAEKVDSARFRSFTDSLGARFEGYVGEHLALFPQAEVHPEIESGGEKSVDWIIVWPGLVLLVEVKLSRLTQAGRMGQSPLGTDLDRTIGKAFQQIRRTAERIERADDAFTHIPSDRPMAAIVVTLEPYWMANTQLVRNLMATPEPEIPTVVASIREIEHLAAASTSMDLSTSLLEMFHDEERRQWNVATSLDLPEGARNPILDTAWEAYPFGPKDVGLQD